MCYAYGSDQEYLHASVCLNTHEMYPVMNKYNIYLNFCFFWHDLLLLTKLNVNYCHNFSAFIFKFLNNYRQKRKD